MEFEYNCIEDLIFSPSFGDWVLSKKSRENKFWIEWENRNSHKIKMINTAKAIIHALQINFDIMPENEVNGEISKLMSVIINLNSGDGYKYR